MKWDPVAISVAAVVGLVVIAVLVQLVAHYAVLLIGLGLLALAGRVVWFRCRY